MVKSDVSDVIVGAALPRVVEPEAECARVTSIQRRVFPKRTVLHVDGPVVDLHAPDREIPADTQAVSHSAGSKVVLMVQSVCGGWDGVEFHLILSSLT